MKVSLFALGQLFDAQYAMPMRRLIYEKYPHSVLLGLPARNILPFFNRLADYFLLYNPSVAGQLYLYYGTCHKKR